MTRLLVCLLLLGACTAVAAHEVRHQAAGGEGGASVDCTDPGAGAPSAAATPAARPASSGHKPVTLRGGDNTLLRAPRWHSFLPGMIR